MQRKLFLLISPIILVVIYRYFAFPEAYRVGDISDWLSDLPIAIAIVLSIWCTHLLVKKLSASVSHNRRIGSYIGACRIGAYIVAYGMYPFISLVGFFRGGTFGGDIGTRILGDVGSIVGIGFGMFILTMVLCSILALLGFFLGGIIQVVCKFLMRLLKRCVLSSP